MESSKNSSVISETVASIAEVERVTITSTPLVENPAMTSLTPVAKRLQLIDIEHENHHDGIYCMFITCSNYRFAF